MHDRTEKQKMLAGELYNGNDSELIAERAKTESLSRAYNNTGDRETLRRLVGRLGENAVIRAPFYCDYGWNVFIDDGAFVNFNAVFLDIMPVTIGAGTQIGPNVQFYAADHPRDPEVRRSGLESGKPITIGRNVWIGGAAILLPGIAIGDDSIIGAGAVVTRDVPAGVTVVGNPARPVTAKLRHPDALVK